MNTSIAWKEKNIIRLDDHKMILDGFTKWCQGENLEIKIKNYSDSDKVFMLIVQSLISSEKIDLFITDYAHPGLNGYEMSIAIRALERALNRPQMPILMLTLVSSKERIIKDGLKEGAFTRYLPLTTDSEAVIKCMEEMIES